jgi:hypothetical protein
VALEDDIRAKLRDLMVEMTLDGALLQALKDAKQGARGVDGATPDTVRKAVEAVLRSRRNLAELDELSEDQKRQIFGEAAREYFDRAATGVDGWLDDDPIKWRNAAREVFDVTSSVI